jgi:hypothetical protein
MTALVHISFGGSRTADKSSRPPGSDTPRGSLYHEAARQRVVSQRQLAAALDSKTTPVLAFASAILPAFGALLTLSGKPVPPEAFAIYGIAFAIYVALWVRVRQALQIRSWHVRPDLARLRSISHDRGEAVARVWAADEYQREYEQNAPQLRVKAHALTAAIVLLPVEAFLLTVAALLVVI